MTPTMALELYVEAGRECPKGFIEIEEGVWEQDCKTQLRSVILQHEASNLFFCICESRSGSYHTDWYYDGPSCYEVTPKVVTSTKYAPV